MIEIKLFGNQIWVINLTPIQLLGLKVPNKYLSILSVTFTTDQGVNYRVEHQFKDLADSTITLNSENSANLEDFQKIAKLIKEISGNYFESEITNNNRGLSQTITFSKYDEISRRKMITKIINRYSGFINTHIQHVIFDNTNRLTRCLIQEQINAINNPPEEVLVSV